MAWLSLREPIAYQVINNLTGMSKPVMDTEGTFAVFMWKLHSGLVEGTSLWVKLFKEGKYAEAVSEFGKYLETVPGISRNSLSSREPGHIPAGVLLVSLLD